MRDTMREGAAAELRFCPLDRIEGDTMQTSVRGMDLHREEFILIQRNRRNSCFFASTNWQVHVILISLIISIRTRKIRPTPDSSPSLIANR